jgi:inosose dehydratase
VTVHRRLAAAPISWGICEVPGWGRMLPADRVLGEMTQLGIRATELGAPGFLPDDPADLQAALDEHGLQLVSSFHPVVVHEADATEAVESTREVARKLQQLGADVLSLALVRDLDWSAPGELTDAEWASLERHLPAVEQAARDEGVQVALHPHVGTVVETAAQIRRALDVTTCGWCLDTGHLLLGGVDPAAFAAEHGGRVVHVHLKDVDDTVAARLRSGELSLLRAVQEGVFVPLGTGDAGVARALEELDRAGYSRWFVLEQDTAITGPEPAVGSGPVLDVKASIDFIMSTAPTEERTTA